MLTKFEDLFKYLSNFLEETNQNRNMDVNTLEDFPFLTINEGTLDTRGMPSKFKNLLYFESDRDVQFYIDNRGLKEDIQTEGIHNILFVKYYKCNRQFKNLSRVKELINFIISLNTHKYLFVFFDGERIGFISNHIISKDCFDNLDNYFSTKYEMFEFEVEYDTDEDWYGYYLKSI